MAFLGLPKKKPQHHGKSKGPKSYLYYAQRRKLHVEKGPTLPRYALRMNLSAASVRGKWHRFCAESRQDPDILLKNLTSADVKSWFDWIDHNFRGLIKAHGTLSNYWRTLKRLYFMKNGKDMRSSMVKDCINYMNEVSMRMGLRRLPLPKDTENSLDLLCYQTMHLVHYKAVFPDEKQRLYHMAALNLLSITACCTVLRCLENHANINTRLSSDWKGRDHLLYVAAKNGYDEIIRTLLQEDVKVDATSTRGRTAISIAASNGHQSVVNELLRAGANYDLADCERKTPLSWAAEHGFVAIVEQLLAAGANINHMDVHGQTPLFLAAQRGRDESVKRLLQANPDTSISAMITGCTALSIAAFTGNCAIVKQLIKAGADVHHANVSDATPSLP